MENSAKIVGIVVPILALIFFSLTFEREFSFIERIISKKLKVIYFPNKPFSYLSPVDGVFLAESKSGKELSYFDGDRVYSANRDKYDFEINYIGEEAVLIVFNRAYEKGILNLIFTGKFLPKYKLVFNLPNRDMVHKGKMSMIEPVTPKPTPVFIPS